MMGFETVTVTVVSTAASTERDRLGNAIPGAPVTVDVPGCLVHPGSTDDMEAGRPDGVTVSLTVHFPKSYTGSLRGCKLDIPGYGTFAVIGDPKPYMDANTPGPWHMPVYCEATDG